MFDQQELDERFMRAALDEAMAAFEDEEVPIGAVIVHRDPVNAGGPADLGGVSPRIIGRGRNQRETLQDPTAHAEIIAVTAAAAHLGTWRLEGCTLYVTLEPCAMCAGAIVLARINRLVYGATDPKAGACESLYQIPTDPRLNHRCEITTGVLRNECAALLSEFFAMQRAKGKK